MAAYDTETWHELFIMTGGAAAALAGLIFVAVSLNHQYILEYAGLPSIAGRTLGILIGIVVFCIIGLTPGQPRVAVGIELAVAGAVLTVLVTRMTTRTIQKEGPIRWRIALIGSGLVATAPALIAGISVITELGGGLYWLAAQFVTGLCVASYYAWILLIEIRR